MILLKCSSLLSKRKGTSVRDSLSKVTGIWLCRNTVAGIVVVLRHRSTTVFRAFATCSKFDCAMIFESVDSMLCMCVYVFFVRML